VLRHLELFVKNHPSPSCRKLPEIISTAISFDTDDIMRATHDTPSDAFLTSIYAVLNKYRAAALLHE